MDIIGGIAGTISLVKTAMEIAKKTKNAELKNALADTLLQLADWKIKVAELLEENQGLKAKAIAAPMQYRGGLYWRGEDGPFCPTCHDTKDRAVRLTDYGDGTTDGCRWLCMNCRNGFYDTKKPAVAEMMLKDGLYYRQNGDGPFCTGCFDSNETAIRVVEQPQMTWNMIGRWRCPKCTTKYKV